MKYLWIAKFYMAVIAIPFQLNINIKYYLFMTDLREYVLDLLFKLHKDYLLLNRICYKVKNQYKREKQFKYATKLKKTLYSIFNMNKRNISSKSSDDIINEISLSPLFTQEAIETFSEFLTNFGKILSEMLGLKLHPSYTVVLLGIISRTYFIMEYFNKHRDKIFKSK